MANEPGPKYRKSDALAWVCEETGDPMLGEDPYQALALFSAHVEIGPRRDGYEEGPQRVSAEEAIAWARARAAMVIVRCCETRANTFDSAGDEPAVVGRHGPFQDWPNGGLNLRPRRLPD
jgi:hypothetical protein